MDKNAIQKEAQRVYEGLFFRRPRQNVSCKRDFCPTMQFFCAHATQQIALNAYEEIAT